MGVGMAALDPGPGRVIGHTGRSPDVSHMIRGSVQADRPMVASRDQRTGAAPDGEMRRRNSRHPADRLLTAPAGPPVADRPDRRRCPPAGRRICPVTRCLLCGERCGPPAWCRCSHSQVPWKCGVDDRRGDRIRRRVSSCARRAAVRAGGYLLRFLGGRRPFRHRAITATIRPRATTRLVSPAAVPRHAGRITVTAAFTRPSTMTTTRPTRSGAHRPPGRGDRGRRRLTTVGSRPMAGGPRGTRCHQRGHQRWRPPR